MTDIQKSKTISKLDTIEMHLASMKDFVVIEKCVCTQLIPGTKIAEQITYHVAPKNAINESKELEKALELLAPPHLRYAAKRPFFDRPVSLGTDLKIGSLIFAEDYNGPLPEQLLRVTSIGIRHEVNPIRVIKIYLYPSEMEVCEDTKRTHMVHQIALRQEEQHAA